MLDQLDHLVVTAPTLEEGVGYVENALGVTPHAGGKHPDMGTHNALLRIGPTSYLEVIAIDPALPSPEVPRWFGLDRREPAPRLANWVAKCADVAASTGLAAFEPGPVRPMRRNELHWHIAFPMDGVPGEGGLLPALIQWPEHAAHPAARLPDDGLELVALQATHPEPEKIRAALESLGLGQVLDLSRGDEIALRARIATPDGERELV